MVVIAKWSDEMESKTCQWDLGAMSGVVIVKSMRPRLWCVGLPSFSTIIVLSRRASASFLPVVHGGRVVGVPHK